MAIDLIFALPLLHAAAALAGSHTLSGPFDPAILGQQLETGIALGAVYALIALGYTMVYGIIELINFAHGDVFMWGTFAAYAVAIVFHIPNQVTGFPLVGVLVGLIIFCMLISGLINVTIERLAYRPLRNAPRLSLLISAIGASFILEDLAKLWRGPSPLPFPAIFPTTSFKLGPVTIPTLDVFIVVLAISLMVALNRFVKLTRIGKAMRATAQDREVASLMGVNINRTIFLTFLIGGALAGAAGVVYAMRVQQIWYFTGFEIGLKAFTAAVLGGIGDIQGAVYGGFLIGLIEAFTAQFFGIQWVDAMVFAVLVLVLVFRPTGLVGVASADKA